MSTTVERAPARERWTPALVGVIVGVVALLNITPHVIGVFFDDGIYALVAKAIAEGKGFVYPQLPGTPPAIHYPPAFPLLLSLVWKLAPSFPENTMWFKLVNPVVLGVAAWAATLLAVRVLRWPIWVAAAITALGFISVPTLVLTSVLLSEPLFLAMMAPALIAATAFVERGGTRLALLAGLATAAVILTRTVGGVLFPAVLLALALERRWRDAAVFAAACILAVLPWQLFVWKHAPGFPDLLRGSYGPYLEWVAGGYREGGSVLVQAVLMKNIEDAWSFLGIFFSPLLRWMRPVAAVVVVLVAIIGVLDGLRDRGRRVFALALGGYLLVVFAWPYQIERFLWGAWPLLILLAGTGLVAAGRAVQGRRIPTIAIAAVAAMLAIGHATYSARGLMRGWVASASARMDERMLPALRLAAKAPVLHGRVLASDIAPALALYTGEQVISLDILRVRDHLAEKSIPERAAVVAALDAAFAPAAYVLLPDSPVLPAFLRAERDPARHFREITPPGLRVRAFLLEKK